VLGVTRRSAMNAVAALQASRLPVIRLEDYCGTHVDAIEVGTNKRQ